jgi:hypothetical protein
MPTLETADGKPVDVTPVDPEKVTADFRAAMDGKGPDEQAPPKRQPKPADEDAPKPRRGRQPKGDQARVTDKAEPVKSDYTEDAQNFVGAVWTVTASLPPTQPYALVVESNADALVSALAEGAKHNTTIRAFVNSGQSSWILGLASVGLSMSMQTYTLMKDPELRKQAAETTRQHLKEAMGAKGLDVEKTAADVAAAA